MISWMQRHRKYLVVTIWISTITFIGAGFVGWGQYSYGDRASAVAKVGTVDITTRELQTAYSNLYNQYSRIFQGNFDQAQAKSFGLEKMALKQLINQALMLNLAKSYGLQISDAELLDVLSKQQAFFKDGVFDKETYVTVLKQNSLSVQEYEEEMRKSLLIQKTLDMLPQSETAHPIELQTLAALNNIADKIEYKVLTADAITVETDEASLRSFWESRKQNYMTQPRYRLMSITQEPVVEAADDAALLEHYNAHRTDFTDADGKILEFDAAKEAVRVAYNDIATQKAALRQFIEFKKEGSEVAAAAQTVEVTAEQNPFGAELFEAFKALTPEDPYIKARKVGDAYKSFKLLAFVPAEPKSFEAAKAALTADYVARQKGVQLEALAKGAAETFNGETTPFITREYAQSLNGLSAEESKQFLDELFGRQDKRGYVTIANTKIVLFHILEQKLLTASQTELQDSVLRLKSTLMDQGVLKMLESRYPTEIYIEGI